MKPQEPIPHNYPMSRLNAIFAISALVLVAVTGLIVAYDYVRGWKWFQMEFMRLQRERIEQKLKLANDDEIKAKLAALDQETRDRQVEIARDREQLLLAQKDLESWEGKHYAADQDYRFAKALLDAKRYELEASIVQKLGTQPVKQREYDELNARVDNLLIRLQQVTRDRDASRARVDQWLGKVKEIEDRRKVLTAEIDLLERQQFTASTNRDFFILNAPMLDFINPTMRVDQVVLNDLFIDMNYMSVPRVDRCVTCHRAIERPGFESKAEARRILEDLQTRLDKNQFSAAKRVEAEERVAELQQTIEGREVMNPFRTHPRLDLFVGSASPHPLLDYGCTACHRGQDRATEFSRAGHTPASGAMERRWSKTWFPFFPLPADYENRNYGWASNPYLETPMYPRQHYEAGCLKCHSNQMTVYGSEEITRATAMVELYGCHSCHKINTWRFSDLQKPGPSLDGIAEKTTPEWTFRWIADPQSFRSTTRMPQFFYGRNMIGPEVPAQERAQNIRFNDAEIHSIVAFLFSKSSNRQWQGGQGGDPARGKEIVGNVGCLGCHVDTETVTTEDGKTRKALRTDFPLERNFGFNLIGTGTKTNPAWLYNWVKNPKNYDQHAPMPDLRLTDQEAADVTAYLMTMQKPEFMQKPIPPADRGAVRGLARSYLINTLSLRDADARLDAMSLDEQLVYLGERSIEKYGCYSCHDLKGFETLKPIGTELTIEGSKNPHLFDFGFTHDYEAWDHKHEHIIHTVPSWIYNKVREPRIYDDGRTKPYNDKLKMPNFHLTPEEARLITSVVVGLTKERVSASKMAATGARERLMEEGRKLVSQRNCRGCHVVDGYGRAIAPLIADTNFLPPDLSPEGARAQSPWLFHFLKDPTVMNIRPWMQVRMPTFHFTDEETNRLVEYFAAAGQAPLFDTHRYQEPPAANVAIGREIYTMLRCAQCHSTAPVDPANPPMPNLADTTSLAPNLSLGRIRLRHDWISDWIRRPDEMIPGTRMPTNFPRSAETGEFSSPLGGNAIDTPAFAANKARLLPHFQSEEHLRQTMSDATALTNFMRDYIWSVGITEMREARPEAEAPVMTVPLQQPQTPPPTPLQTGEAVSSGVPVSR